MRLSGSTRARGICSPGLARLSLGAKQDSHVAVAVSRSEIVANHSGCRDQDNTACSSALLFITLGSDCRGLSNRGCRWAYTLPEQRNCCLSVAIINEHWAGRILADGLAWHRIIRRATCCDLSWLPAPGWFLAGTVAVPMPGSGADGLAAAINGRLSGGCSTSSARQQFVVACGGDDGYFSECCGR